MEQLNNVLEQCDAVWEDWNDQTVASRIILLQRWSETVAARGDDFAQAASMIRFQCDSADRLLNKVHELPGPTGETNELYTAGRGTVAVTGDASLTSVALCGQLAAALVAGNCVVVSVEGTHADMVDAVLADLVALVLTRLAICWFIRISSGWQRQGKTHMCGMSIANLHNDRV
jgi:NAD-dependent aldehyde dehydrogenases